MGTVAKVQEAIVDPLGKCLTCGQFFEPPDPSPGIAAHIEANREHVVRVMSATEREFAWVE